MPHAPAIVLTLAGLAVFAASAAAAPDPLAAYRWRDRVVVALAGSRSDPALAEQRRLLAGAGARERDLRLIEAIDGTPAGDALRRRFGGTGFRAVLIGKDGGEKQVADRPLGPDDLFPLIDSMPMRQEEMRRRP